MNQVVVTQPDLRSLREVRGQRIRESFSWVYLGQSPDELARATRCFSGHGVYQGTVEKTHLAADTLRESYLAYLYQIGRQLNSLRWWLTSLSYRSVYHSETFFQACLLKTGLDLINSWGGPGRLVLVVSDDPVRQALQLNKASAGEMKVEFIRRSQLSSIFAFPLLKVLVRRVYFVLNEWWLMLQSQLVVQRPHVPHGPSTILVSTVSPRNVQLGVEFHTFFFGDLADKLSNLGHNVTLMPRVMREVPYKKTLTQLIAGQFPVWIPHRNLKLLDPVVAAIRTISKPPVLMPTPLLSDLDISPLVQAELCRYWISNRGAHNLLLATALCRLADRGAEVNRIIYVYENQPWERALCWQVRHSFPSATLVGYQHARAPRMLLNFYLAPGGEEMAPLPDRIVTVGEYSARMFSSGGYDSKRVHTGGAFQSINGSSSAGTATMTLAPENAASVLIAPSMGQEEARELVETALHLFNEDDGVRVVIKCHPAMPFSKIIGASKFRLPGHVQVSDESIQTLMPKSAAMVYTSSTVCVQALAMGLPVLHLRRQFGLDLDPLEFESPIRMEADGIEALRSKLRWLLEHRQEYVDAHQAQWNDLVGQIYGPVTQQTYLAFAE